MTRARDRGGRKMVQDVETDEECDANRYAEVELSFLGLQGLIEEMGTMKSVS